MDDLVLLYPDEAAKRLRVGKTTIYALAKSGALPAVRIGRAVRFDPLDIAAYIERQKYAHTNVRPIKRFRKDG